MKLLLRFLTTLAVIVIVLLSGPGGASYEYLHDWRYVVLAADFATSSASAVDVTGINFIPVAKTRYEIHGVFLLRTAATTSNARLGVAWPIGMTDGVVALRVNPQAATQYFQFGNINAAVLTPVGTFANTTQSWPGELNAVLIAGTTPSGAFQIQLAAETSGTNATMMAGSYFRYRSF